MQQRKDEIQAKKAKLAEMKRQREEREREFAAGRQSLGSPLGTVISPRRNEDRQELNSLITSLVGESRVSTPAQKQPISPARAARFPSRIAFDAEIKEENQYEPANARAAAKARQSLSFAPLKTLYEIKADPPKPEIITYNKGVQTTDQRTFFGASSSSDSEADYDRNGERRPMRKLSRRQREKEEELRLQIRKDVEQELRAQPPVSNTLDKNQEASRLEVKSLGILTVKEVEAVTTSFDFMDFLDRSSKVAQKALEENYDVLADYRLDHLDAEDEEDGGVGTKGGKGRRVKEILQFYDERWSKKRMVTDLSFSSKFPELVLASYTKNSSAPNDPDGLIQIWNTHMQDRPEYAFHATSDILTAKFHPFYPNLVLGGTYSGQVLLWDTRSRSHSPVQQTSLTSAGHSHPIYSLNVVGTHNAHNIITTSTDGVMCSWATDMLSIPQQHLLLRGPPPPSTGMLPNTRSPFARDLAVICAAFPPSQTTYFLAGTESGPIHLCHRHDRAGAPAGVDPMVSYPGHAAPVMSIDFHNAAGPHNLGDLVLSTGLDWAIKLWRVRTPTGGVVDKERGKVSSIQPLLEIPRDDAVYDAKWSPARPGIFASVDGGGYLEVWDLNADLEEPVARERTAPRGKLGSETAHDMGIMDGGGFAASMEGVGGGRSLNKCAWEAVDGKRIVVGGLDGVVSVFEVGSELSGAERARSEEWDGVKRLVSRLEGGYL